MQPVVWYVSTHEANLQVRDLIERDLEVVLTCLTCERSRIWMMDDILQRFRSSPGATLTAIQQRARCPGCGGPARVTTADGPHFSELLPRRHDHLERKASFVRRVLSHAGIDPASWGYPPL